MNTRERDYESQNVKKELSHKNIILEDSKIRTQEQLREITKSKLGKGKRQISEDSSHSFMFVIDSSKYSLSEEENIKFYNFVFKNHKYIKYVFDIKF